MTKSVLDVTESPNNTAGDRHKGVGVSALPRRSIMNLYSRTSGWIEPLAAQSHLYVIVSPGGSSDSNATVEASLEIYRPRVSGTSSPSSATSSVSYSSRGTYIAFCASRSA